VQIAALLALFNAGNNTAETGGNWVYEVVSDLLADVMYEGPFKANETDPRHALTSFGYKIAEFLSWVSNAQTMAERHPRLFAAPLVEPEAAPEPVTASKPAKRLRGRKSRRKAA